MLLENEMTKRNTKKSLLCRENTKKCSLANLKMDISSQKNNTSEQFQNSSCKKQINSKSQSDIKKTLTNVQKEQNQTIFEIRTKLDDPSYIEGAVYRLATIITNRILKLRGEL